MANRAEWTKRIQRWQASGLTAREFAEREDLRERSLAWWKWKLKSAPATSAPATAITFLPVRVVDVPAERPTANDGFEIALPNGRVVRIPPSFDDATVERLLVIAAGGAR